MTRLRRWKHRFGLRRTEGRLRKLLMRFRFTDVRGWLEEGKDHELASFEYALSTGTGAQS
jgi:hypothetical protein